MKRTLANILRGVISFGLLAYLIYMADISQIYATLKAADYRYFAVALVIFLGTVVLFALRWQILLRESRIEPGYNRLLAFYLIGYFLNNFLPTSIGGDLSRVYNVARVSGKPATSFGIVILERIMGFVATLTLAAGSLYWAMRYFHTTLIVSLTLSSLLLLLFILLYLLNPSLYNFTSRFLSRFKWWGIGKKSQRVLSAIHALRESKKAIFKAYLLSLICQVMLIGMNYLLALALGLYQLSPGYLFLVVPVTFVMGMIPSINGLGVRDYGYLELLSRAGLSSAEALSLSFLNTLVPLLMSLVGGVLMIFYRNNLPDPAIGKLEVPAE